MFQNPPFALWGAAPRFSSPLHVGRPNLPERSRILAGIESVLDSRWLTNYGQQVQAFEAELAEFLEVPHVVAVCNATLGLIVALKALAQDGEVIVPAFTFPATVQAIEWAGLRPHFCDINPHTHQLDPQAVEACIRPQTRAILGVHLWGWPCAPKELEALALQHQIPLIFDSAHALGCQHQGKKTGNWGSAEVFSFHATKFVNSLEGGAITTGSGELAQQLRRMINFGFDAHGHVSELGLNAKMNEISAVFGRESLRQLPEIVTVNRQHHRHYQQILNVIPGLTVLPAADNAQYVVLDIDAAFGLTRDQVWQILQAEQALVRRYFWPGAHKSAPYKSQAWILPATDTLAKRLLILPTGTGIHSDEIAVLCQIISECHEKADLIHSHWPQ